jgi:hypothetical protein
MNNDTEGELSPRKCPENAEDRAGTTGAVFAAALRISAVKLLEHLP